MNNYQIIGTGLSPNPLEDLPRTAFGEIRTANYEPLTAWAFTHNINPAIIRSTIGNGGTVTHNLGHAVLNTGSDPNGSARITTIRASRYVPGVSGTVGFSKVFGTPQENSKQVIGLINHSDGWGFGYNGLEFGILRKYNNIEYWIPQTEWNINKRPDLNPQKGNVYRIEYQWYGYGAQYFYIENRYGMFELVHRINYANNYTEPSVLNPNLPLSSYVENYGNTTPIISKTASASAGLEGDAFNDSLSTNISGKSRRDITAGDTPFLAFRIGETYKGLSNRLFCQALRLSTASELNKTVTIDAYAGGTVNDGTWFYPSEEVSPLEVNNTLTSYTQGLFIGAFPLGKTDSKDYPLGDTKFRFYAGQQIVLVASTEGSGEIRASVNWKSFV